MFRTTLFRIHDMYMHALYNFNFHATEVCIHDMYTCTHCTCPVFKNTQPTYCTTSTSMQLKFAISPNNLTTILVPWAILITVGRKTSSWTFGWVGRSLCSMAWIPGSNTNHLGYPYWSLSSTGSLCCTCKTNKIVNFISMHGEIISAKCKLDDASWI